MLHHMQTKQQWSGQLRKPTNICSQKVSTWENTVKFSSWTVKMNFLADKVKLKILRLILHFNSPTPFTTIGWLRHSKQSP